MKWGWKQMRNNNIPDRATIENLRGRYPKGTRVELIYMDDPYSTLKTGDQGTVIFVDDIGTIHVAWDCGSSLGIAYRVDYIKKL